MESAECRAVVVLLLLGLTGQGVRWALGRPGEPPGQVALLPVERRGSPAAHRDSALAAARPLAQGETLDPDRASIQELLRLPRVGPALARTILADRETKGPFGSLAGFDRVPGVGPKLLESLQPYLRFQGGVLSRPAPSSGDLNLLTAAELEALPGIGPALAQRIVAYRESHGRFADIGALGAVPGVGPALIARLRPLLRAP